MMQSVKLGQLVKIRTGKLDVNAETIDGPFPFFTCSKESKRINSYSFDGEYVIVAGNGDLNVKYYLGKFDVYQRTYTLKPGPELDGKFLFYFMSKYVEHLRELSIGGVIKYIKLGNLTDALIPLPPLEEQKKIAAILDAADDYRQKTKVLINKYDQLTQSLFLDMFGDPFIENNKKNIVPFKELTNRITYGFTNPMKHLDSGIPILTAKNIRNGYIDYEKTHFADEEEYNKLTIKSKPEKFDILITKDGSIGRTAMLESDFPVCINQSVALVKPKKEIVNPKYLVGYLVSAPVQRKIQNMGKGAGLKHLQITELAEFPTVLFSLNEQNQFAERVAQIETQKQQAEASLVKAEELFNSLLQRAFKGELTN